MPAILEEHGSCRDVVLDERADDRRFLNGHLCEVCRLRRFSSHQHNAGNSD
jgi:hypothetical protein